MAVSVAGSLAGLEEGAGKAFPAPALSWLEGKVELGSWGSEDEAEMG